MVDNYLCISAIATGIIVNSERFINPKINRCLKTVIEKVHSVDPLVRVPVSAEPGFVVCFLLNLIQPSFGAVINGALVDHWKEHLHRLIFKWAGVGEDYIKATRINSAFHRSLDFSRRLLILPPAVRSLN